MIYETVILGSGYFSLGYASSHDKTLIIEETQLLDPHFFGTLSGFSMSVGDICAKGEKALLESFVDEGVIADGRVAVNELEPALCRFVECQMPDILLGSFCSDIRKTDNGYEVEICNNEGVSRVLANRVIDTRLPAGNKINLLLAVNAENLPKAEGLQPAFYSDQAVVSLEFDSPCDINEAKSRALNLLEDTLRASGARIVCTSYRMFGADKFAPYTDEKGVLHVDETNMGGIFAAYGKGELFDDTFGS